jgi:1-deoxy-D-xylulose-5-phosphate synthase
VTLPESIDGPQYVKRLNQEQRTQLARETRDQSDVHKLLTGRQSGFAKLRQRGGVSGYPSRGELELDLVENSHASASLSYAGGLARSLRSWRAAKRSAPIEQPSQAG